MADDRADRDDLAAHLDRFGPQPQISRSRLLDALAHHELTGRGGGHFPVARKWMSLASGAGPTMVVANGAESEPCSAKDAALLHLRPHLVLDGLALTAHAVGATEVVVWLHESAVASHRSLARALAERDAAGVGDPPVRVVLAPDRYLSGESSAIIRALSGGPSLPEFRRVPATVSGVGGRPTLVHNVETLARIALAGRGMASATVLLTVSRGASMQVIEVETTTRLLDAVHQAGVVGPVPALLLGGFGGRWVAGATAATLYADPRSLTPRHLSLGAGVVVALRPGDCGLARTAEIADYLAQSSARQCGPCVFGLRAVADQVAELVAGHGGRRTRGRLERFLAEIHGRGACHHPDGAVGMVASAIDVFSPDVQSHLRRGACTGA